MSDPVEVTDLTEAEHATKENTDENSAIIPKSEEIGQKQAELGQDHYENQDQSVPEPQHEGEISNSIHKDGLTTVESNKDSIPELSGELLENEPELESKSVEADQTQEEVPEHQLEQHQQQEVQDTVQETVADTAAAPVDVTKPLSDQNQELLQVVPEEQSQDSTPNSPSVADIVIDTQAYSDEEINVDDISSGSDSESESDSGSDSDSDVNSTESESEEEEDTKTKNDSDEGEVFDDDEEGEVSGGPILSKNEVTNEVAPALPEGYALSKDAPIEPIGEIISLVENSMVIKANTSGEFRILKEKSVFCLEDRTIIGLLYETFGRIQEPIYSIKFNSKEDFERFKDTKGQLAYYVVPDSEFVYTDAIKSIRGTDASNCHDEELPEEEQEFSDDEMELEAKRSKKKKNKSKKKENENPDKPIMSKDRKRPDPSNITQSHSPKRFQPYGYAEPPRANPGHTSQKTTSYNPLHNRSNNSHPSKQHRSPEATQSTPYQANPYGVPFQASHQQISTNTQFYPNQQYQSQQSYQNQQSYQSQQPYQNQPQQYGNPSSVYPNQQYQYPNQAQQYPSQYQNQYPNQSQYGNQQQYSNQQQYPPLNMNPNGPYQQQQNSQYNNNQAAWTNNTQLQPDQLVQLQQLIMRQLQNGNNPQDNNRQG